MLLLHHLFCSVLKRIMNKGIKISSGKRTVYVIKDVTGLQGFAGIKTDSYKRKYKKHKTRQELIT